MATLRFGLDIGGQEIRSTDGCFAIANCRFDELCIQIIREVAEAGRLEVVTSFQRYSIQRLYFRVSQVIRLAD